MRGRTDERTDATAYIISLALQSIINVILEIHDIEYVEHCRTALYSSYYRHDKGPDPDHLD